MLQPFIANHRPGLGRVDEAVLVNYIVKKRGGKGFLDDKVLLGSMNRTGLSGAEHEMMDRTSSYMTGKRIKEMNLDGSKLLYVLFPIREETKIWLEHYGIFLLLFAVFFLAAPIGFFINLVLSFFVRLTF